MVFQGGNIFINFINKLFEHDSNSHKKQIDNYLPLLTIQQQELLLQMAKSLLHIETKEQNLKM